ncbi:hypothetical protein FKM82_000431 [Ascaphus truei]
MLHHETEMADFHKRLDYTTNEGARLQLELDKVREEHQQLQVQNKERETDLSLALSLLGDIESRLNSNEDELSATLSERRKAEGLLQDLRKDLESERAGRRMAEKQKIKSKDDEGEAALEHVLPEPAVYADYLLSYLQNPAVLTEEQKADMTQIEAMLIKEFIGQQLILIVGCLDTSEEGGRKRLLAVLQEMLVIPNTPTSLITCLVELLLRIVKDDDRRIQIVAEIVSELREPIVSVDIPADAAKSRKLQLKTADLRVQLNEAKQALEDSIVLQDFSLASELKEIVSPVLCPAEVLRTKRVGCVSDNLCKYIFILYVYLYARSLYWNFERVTKSRADALSSTNAVSPHREESEPIQELLLTSRLSRDLGEWRDLSKEVLSTRKISTQLPASAAHGGALRRSFSSCWNSAAVGD